ncbi:alcohol dehydrogenase catalytic domain-containing protein [Candidatus Poribacteria bacterium]|nr:alcohol dehydrogenase catalytic domain-containing protein [Candidatus Poribacteria bacterium]
MKAAVLEGLEKITVKEVETPKLEDDRGLLLKMKSCAVCGSDLRIYHYGNPRVKPPQIIGHEIAGEVAEVGSKVNRFKVGDRVAIGADVPCGECAFCRDGQGNNCEINYAMGYQFPGGFAEYLLVDPLVITHGPIHKIPGELGYDEAALAEPLACCINGLELSWLSLGDTVAIIGAGPVGCMMAELARYMGARKVMISQRSKTRLEMAKKYDIDVVISATEEDFTERVMEETDGMGADVVLTATSSLEAQKQALTVIKNRGRVNFFAGLPKGTDPIMLDTNMIHYKECYLFGSHGSTPRHHRMALEFLASGRINARKFISHNFPLDQIMEAFDTVESRKGMKVVINP